MATRREFAKNTFVFIDNRNGDFDWYDLIAELQKRGGFYCGMFHDQDVKNIWTTNKYGIICIAQGNDLMQLQKEGYKCITKDNFITKKYDN